MYEIQYNLCTIRSAEKLFPDFIKGFFTDSIVVLYKDFKYRERILEFVVIVELLFNVRNPIKCI
jgi:hypothetical protein